MPMNFVPAEQRFQVMFEQAAMGILQTDMAYRFVLANQFFCAMLGYAHVEDISQRKATEVALRMAQAQHQLLCGRWRPGSPSLRWS